MSANIPSITITDIVIMLLPSFSGHIAPLVFIVILGGQSEKGIQGRVLPLVRFQTVAFRAVLSVCGIHTY
ncbi:hypothetical protein GSVR_37100 [Geobacter sp. SVR]|nr:hypothetical protein GSVR_37100 [Geobacter sp. SVR]